MTAQPQVLKIRRPDDWHIHLRDDEMLKTVVPYTSRIWPGDRDAEPGSPVTTVAAARAYRDRILAAVPQGHNFTPLMTCYLTNSPPPVNWSTASSKGCLPPPSCIRPTLRPTPATASAT